MIFWKNCCWKFRIKLGEVERQFADVTCWNTRDRLNPVCQCRQITRDKSGKIRRQHQLVIFVAPEIDDLANGSLLAGVQINPYHIADPS
ncbi:hypothetical protein D3C76_149980 [compost metagenome]